MWKKERVQNPSVRWIIFRAQNSILLHNDCLAYIAGGIGSAFSLSATLFIEPETALKAAASIPAPSTPDVPVGTRRGPSDSWELTPATLLLLLLLRDKIWKLLRLLECVIEWVTFSAESSVGGTSKFWFGSCFPMKWNHSINMYSAYSHYVRFHKRLSPNSDLYLQINHPKLRKAV